MAPPPTRPTVVCWKCRALLALRLSPEPANVVAYADADGSPFTAAPADRTSTPVEWTNDGNSVEFHCPECDARQGYDLADL